MSLPKPEHWTDLIIWTLWAIGALLLAGLLFTFALALIDMAVLLWP